MSHLLAQKGDEMKAQKPAATRADVASSGGPASPKAANAGGAAGAGAAGDRNSVKSNLNLAIDIIHNCFNLDAPKSIQKIGLFKLQELLPDFKLLYPLYVNVLAQTDDDIKQMILSEEPMRPGEEIFYSFGSGSFRYKLKSDVNLFDKYLLANSLIDIIIAHGYDQLHQQHMQIFMLCIGNNSQGLNQSQNADSWFKVFQKIKDFILIAICDEELVNDTLVILHTFLTSPALKFQVYDYEDCRDQLQRSIELLYDGNSEYCKERFREYLEEKVVQRTEDTDNALKKFFKNIIYKMS